MQDDFDTPCRTWRTFSNHGGASAPSRIFHVGTIASKVLAKGNTWSTGGSRTTPSGDRIGRGTLGRIASRGFPARVSPPAWKATWPAQNKPTRPSIFSLIHNSYQGEFLIRTWQLLTIHVHARMIYLTKPLEFISACSHSTCTMRMPALSTAIMNHCMLLRTNRQDAARSKPSITNCSQLRIRCCPAGLLPRSRLQKVSLKTSPHMEPHLQGQCIAIITQVHASTLMKLSAAEQMQTPSLDN